MRIASHFQSELFTRSESYFLLENEIPKTNKYVITARNGRTNALNVLMANEIDLCFFFICDGKKNPTKYSSCQIAKNA